MRLSVGTLDVDMTRAEAARFRHPLLVVHGLWTGAWIWGGVAAYLAHRGWETWAPSLGGAAAPEATLGALTEVVQAMPAAPIVLTHGTGVVLGASLAARSASPALVAIGPLVAPADAPSGGLFGPLARWRARGALVAAPRAVAAAVAAAGRAEALPDSGEIYRALATSRLRLPRVLSGPAVAMSHADDELSTAETAGTLAAVFGWEQRRLPGGHLALARPGFERVADVVHRWIVHALGADLLAFLDDEKL